MRTDVKSHLANLSKLRYTAAQLAHETRGGRERQMAEEAFTRLEDALRRGDLTAIEALHSTVENGYRQAIVLALRRTVRRTERQLSENDGGLVTSAYRALKEGQERGVDSEEFLKLAEAAMASVSAATRYARPAHSWAEQIRTVSECFRDGRSDGWRLSQDARLLQHGETATLEISNNGRAEWIQQPVWDGRLDFEYCPGTGVGVVMLRLVHSDRGDRAYAVRLESSRIAIDSMENGETRRLCMSGWKGQSGEFHDISIWLSGVTVLVAGDGRAIVQVSDDTRRCRPGCIVLTGEGAEGIRYRNIRLTHVPVGTLPLPEERQSPLDDLHQVTFKAKKAFAHTPLSRVVALEVKPVLGPKRVAPINAGDVPPEWAHTWGMDIVGVTRFSLDLPSPLGPELMNRISLEWQAGDRLTFLDYSLANPVIETFTSNADLGTKWVCVQPAPGGGAKRIYMVLATGSGGPPRRFQVSALHADDVISDGEVLLVSDDLNYDLPGPLCEAKGYSAQPIKLYAPWKPYSPGVPVGVAIPEPALRDGWHLLARNTEKRDTPVFTFLYYNERTSRLRVYLYNLALSTDATCYQVSISLASRVPGQGFMPLNGAFFPADPRPQRWSSASFTIPVWPASSWAFVETSMLYPMAEKIPGAKRPPDPNLPGHYYRPLYEEACEKGLANVKLVVTVQGCQIGSFQGDLIAEAIGEAIQQSASSSMSGVDILKGAASAIASGKDYYDKGKSLHDALKSFIDKKIQEGTPQSDLAGLQGLVALGAGAWGGFMGIVGLGLGIYQAFFAKPEPLRLALELAVKGSLAGSVFTPLTTIEQTFFMPGRWSIQEAFQGNFPVTTDEYFDAETPRYARTLGHFGYRYNPGEVEFRLLNVCYAFDDIEDVTDKPEGMEGLYAQRRYELTRYIFPARDLVAHNIAPSPYLTMSMPQWLPVVYNPYAEIVPLKPIPVATAEDRGIKVTVDAENSPEVPWFDWLQDLSPEAHITPEPGDNGFPRGRCDVGVGSRMYVKFFPLEPWALFNRPSSFQHSLDEGIWMSVQPVMPFVPTTCRGFAEIHDLLAHTWWDVFVACDYNLYRGFRDIIFYWDVAYFHYPRSRQLPTGDIPLYRGTANLLSPVSVDRRWVGLVYSDDEGIWFPYIDKQKSMLLLQ